MTFNVLVQLARELLHNMPLIVLADIIERARGMSPGKLSKDKTKPDCFLKMVLCTSIIFFFDFMLYLLCNLACWLCYFLCCVTLNTDLMVLLGQNMFS